MRITLEVVVATAADAVAATAGGADRLELVAHLHAGGITPHADVVRAARLATRLPLYVMIRPRGGSFIFADAEVAAMAADARMARALGADGLVVGAGVTMANAAAILRQTGVRALHTATAVRDPQLPAAAVSAERVRQMRRILDGGV